MTKYYIERGCMTCCFRKPNDVDLDHPACESCMHLHITGSELPWPMWTRRSNKQLREDAKLGHKAKIKILTKPKGRWTEPLSP